MPNPLYSLPWCFCCIKAVPGVLHCWALVAHHNNNKTKNNQTPQRATFGRVSPHFFLVLSVLRLLGKLINKRRWFNFSARPSPTASMFLSNPSLNVFCSRKLFCFVTSPIPAFKSTVFLSSTRAKQIVWWYEVAWGRVSWLLGVSNQWLLFYGRHADIKIQPVRKCDASCPIGFTQRAPGVTETAGAVFPSERPLIHSTCASIGGMLVEWNGMSTLSFPVLHRERNGRNKCSPAECWLLLEFPHSCGFVETLVLRLIMR